MNYWLFKTEPDVFGIRDLEKQGVSVWDGVRNYQARNFLRACSEGDEVFIYHSSCSLIGIAGIGKIHRGAYPDPTQFDASNPLFDIKSSCENPRWSAVDVAYVRTFPQVIPLQKLKAHPGLQEMSLVKKGSRLSVMPVTSDEYQLICAMC